MIHLANIIDEVVVPHSSFIKATKAITQCLRYSATSNVPVCVALFGESRTGKSFVIEQVIKEHPEDRTADGLIVPVLYVETPANPSPNSFAEEVLKELGDPLPSHGTESAKSRRLVKMLKAAQTRMIVIDEFQQIVDRRSQKVWYDVADWLKLLADKARISLVVSGLPEGRHVIAQNPQLAGRFLAPITMPRFSWTDAEQLQEFVDILAAFHDAMKVHFELPPFASESMIFRMYCATGGLVGYITKIVRKALWNAIDAKTTVIRLEDLAIAFEEAVARWDRFAAALAPFHPDFGAQPAPELLHAARQVGTEVIDPTEAPPPTRSRRRRPPSAAAALGA